jgi:hypothetical protein
MKTDRLFDALARDTGATPGHIAERRLALAGIVGLGVAFVMVATIFGVREDLGRSVTIVLLKAAFGVAALAAALPLLLELARPNTSARRAAAPAALFAAASIAIAVSAYLVTPPAARMAAWVGGDMPECLYRIPLLAVPIAVALFLAVRGLGPTRLTLAGAAIGAVSGSIAAIAYASCCQMDSALYVASWYLAAILFCAAVGAVAIGRVLKW